MSPSQKVQINQAWRAEIWRDWNLPVSLKDQWEELAGLCGEAELFLVPALFEIWWGSFGESRDLFLIFLFEQENLRGIFPLSLNESSSNGKLLSSLTNDHTFLYDFIIHPEFQKETLHQLFNLCQSWWGTSPIRLENFTQAGPNWDILEGELLRRGYYVHTYKHPCSPFINLDFNWEKYFADLPSNLRRNLRHRRRRAEEEGRLSFEVVRETADLENILTEAFEVESSSWKGVQGTSINSKPHIENFYRELAKWASKKGKFYLFVLRLNRRMISFRFCLAGQKTMYSIKTGYDQVSAAQFSPGSLILCHLLEYLYNSREFTRFVFMGVSDKWKMEWNAISDTNGWLDAFPNNFKGWCQYSFRYGWKKAIKRFLRLVRIPGFAAS